MKAGQNAYRDRRLKKRTFHQLWILRINAACREHEIKYSRFIYGCELAGIEINRKMLSELAINHPEAFKEAKAYEKTALKDGSPFTWAEGESLEDIQRPERIEEIKKNYQIRLEQARKRLIKNSLRSDGKIDVDDVYGKSKVCLACHK